MSRSLTTDFTVQKNSKTDVAPINLLVIEFGGVIGTKYYSDRVIIAGSDTYEAVVSSWGQLEAIVEGTSTSKDIRISLVNTLETPISNIFLTVVPEGKVVKLYQFFDDASLADSDKLLIFNGTIISVMYDLDHVELDIVDKIVGLENQIGSIVNTTDYPKALSDHIGRVIPQVYGSVDNVPAVCVSTAGRSSLVETITEAQTIIVVDDGTSFPDSGTWVLIVEEEHIQISSKNVHTLTVFQRGYNSTTPAIHNKGVEVYEQLSEFIYKVHDGEAKSISNIRVNGYLVDPSEYTVDLPNGQIKFMQYPNTTEEKETVFDSYYPDSVPDLTGTPYGKDIPNLIDSDKNNFAELRPGQYLRVQRTASLDNINQFKRAFIIVKYFTNKDWNEGTVTCNVYWANNILGALNPPPFEPEPPKVVEQAGNTRDSYEQPTPTSGVFTTRKITIINNPVDATPPGANPENKSVETKSQASNVDGSAGVLEGKTDDTDVRFFKASTSGTSITFDSANIILQRFNHTILAYADYEYVNFKISGFSPQAPDGDIWRIVNIEVKYTSSMSAGRVSKTDYMVNGTSNVKWQEVWSNDFDIEWIRLRISGEYITWYNMGFNKELNYNGSVNSVYVRVTYEKEITIPDDPEEPSSSDPDPNDPGVPTDPPQVELPARVSQTSEQSFEITSLISSMSDLLNENIDINFETNTIDDNRIYFKEVYLYLETSAYKFEYTDMITADVEGYYVDGSTITIDYGALSEVIRRPDQTIKLILTHIGAFSLSDINTVAYTNAATFFTIHGYYVDFALVEQITLRALLESIAFQVRSDQYWEDGIHNVKVLESNLTPIKTLTASEVSSVTFERSDINEVINIMELRYKYDYGSVVDYMASRYRGVVKIEDTDSQVLYGNRKDVNKKFFFDKIRSVTTVSHVAAYYLAFYSAIKTILKVECYLDQIELEKHDIIGITWPLDNMTNSPCRVLGGRLILGSSSSIDKFELILMREDYTYLSKSLSDSVGFSDVATPILVLYQALSDGIELSDAESFVETIPLSDTVDFSESISFTWTKSLNLGAGYGFGKIPFGTGSFGSPSII